MNPSHHSHPASSEAVHSETAHLNWSSLGFWPFLFLIIGLGAAGVSFLGAWHTGAWTELAFSWLFAFMFCYTICVGSAFWMFVHHAVDARWSVVVRRIFENIAALLPWLAVLFIPLVWLAPLIWRWMQIPHGADVLLDHKAGYLNHTFFYIRAIFYFTFFSVAGLGFRFLSTNQDKTANPWHSLRMRKFSYAAIPLLALSLTFSAFDWLMSLDHHWFSTMWGVYIFAGSILNAMALTLLVSQLLRAKGYLRGIVTVEHDHIMGKLIYAFIVFWAYIAFSQYMLMYYSNIPEETIFYASRNEGSWRWMSYTLLFGHFVLPFLFLLTQPAKRTPWRICLASGWILFMHAVDLYWIIMPMRQVVIKEGLAEVMKIQAAHGHSEMATFGTISFHWLDATSLLAFIGILGFIAMRYFTSVALYPVKDFRLKESIQISN